jgi:hypothetical protein
VAFERHVGGEGASAEFTLRRLVGALVLAHSPQLTVSRPVLLEYLDADLVNANVSPVLSPAELCVCAARYRAIDKMNKGLIGFVDLTDWVDATYHLSGLCDSPLFVALCDVVRTLLLRHWDAEELIIFFHRVCSMSVRNIADFVFDRLANVQLAGGEMARRAPSQRSACDPRCITFGSCALCAAGLGQAPAEGKCGELKGQAPTALHGLQCAAGAHGRRGCSRGAWGLARRGSRCGIRTANSLFLAATRPRCRRA